MNTQEDRILAILRDLYANSFSFTSAEATEELLSRGFPRGTITWVFTRVHRDGQLERLKQGVYRIPKDVERLEIPESESLLHYSNVDDFAKTDLFKKNEKDFLKRYRAREERFQAVLYHLPPGGMRLRRKLGVVRRETRVQPLTTELALKYATMAEMDGDRPFDVGRAVELARNIEITDLPFQWASCLIREGSVTKEVRVNGRTSSWTCLLAPHLIRENSEVVTTVFDCGDDLELVKYIYRCFDTDISVRSQRDRVRSAIAGHDLLKGTSWPNGVLGKIFSGLKTYSTGYYLKHKEHIRPEEMVDVCGPELLDFMRIMFFLKYADDRATRSFGARMIKRDLVAGAYWTYQHYPAATLGFLLEIRDRVALDGSALDRAAPTSMFADDFLRMVSSPSGGRKKNAIPITSNELMGYYRNVWNAWCDGKPRDFCKRTLPAPLKDCPAPARPKNLTEQDSADLSAMLELICADNYEDAYGYLKTKCRG